MKGSIDSFWHWQVSGLAISSVAACFGSPNIHSVDIASFQPLKSQHSSFKLVFGLYSCPTSILYSNLCLPFHPPPTRSWAFLTLLCSSNSPDFLSDLAGTSTNSNYSARKALEHNKMVHLLCKSYLHTHTLWVVVVV